MITLSNIRIEKNGEWSRLRCDMKSDTWGDEGMWFEIPSEYKEYFSTQTYDCFLVTILFPAMYYHEDITIKGTVSKKLFRNITPYVQAVLKAYKKSLEKISIMAESLVVPVQKNNLVATGFSGGIDSFSTFHEYYEKETDRDYKINTLFFFNVGSHGRFDDEKTYEKFLARYEYLKAFPDEKGIPFIPVNSNLHFFHKEFGHQRTHPISLCAGILAFESSVSKYYLSSALNYTNAKLFSRNQFNFDLAEFSETYLLPLLSTETCALIPDGEQYSRSEKTECVINYDGAQKFLNVCVNDLEEGEKNCSCCPKCLRTLTALDSADALDKFAHLFDLQVYRKHRFKYRCQLVLQYGKEPFATDNIDFAKKYGKKFPSKIVAFFVCLPQILKGWLRKILVGVLGEKTWKILRGKK